MRQYNFFAVDLGATSGRTIIGTFSDGQLSMRVNTRFHHDIIHMQGHQYWDLLHLYQEIVKGLQKAASEHIRLDSIGIDTWGVDFVLIGKDGMPLRSPYSYRDPHTEGMMDEYFKIIPAKQVYEATGIQFMSFNTLFQLYTLWRHHDAALAQADKILLLPDALSYLLTGKMVTERTILSTSQMMDPSTGKVIPQLLQPMGIREEQFAPYAQPGQQIGALTSELQQLTGLGAVPVVAVAGHDTASAVAAVPAEDKEFAYLSSGTWSLMGIETPQPIINEKSYEENFTNEGGIEGTTRFLKNICGMWLFERCRAEWSDAPDDYDQFYANIEGTPGFHSFIYPDAPEFAHTDSMVSAIQTYCRETGQPVPDGYKAIARCIFDSLAMRYRQVFHLLETMAPFALRRLHIIGGGSQNYLLNQFTANALGVDVYAGPQEATATGNIMMQAKACGLVKDVWEMRSMIRHLVQPRLYKPQDTGQWAAAYDQYLKVTSKNQKH